MRFQCFYKVTGNIKIGVLKLNRLVLKLVGFVFPRLISSFLWSAYCVLYFQFNFAAICGSGCTIKTTFFLINICFAFDEKRRWWWNKTRKQNKAKDEIRHSLESWAIINLIRVIRSQGLGRDDQRKVWLQDWLSQRVCGWGLIGISWPEGASQDGNEILRDLVFLWKDIIFYYFKYFFFCSKLIASTGLITFVHRQAWPSNQCTKFILFEFGSAIKWFLDSSCFTWE